MPEEEVKERMGKLGLYIINKAKEEIKDINQRFLSQKAEIKLRTLDRTNESISKLRDQFSEMYDRLLNNTLTSSLMKTNAKALGLKNRLLDDLKEDLTKLIIEKIEKNHSDYVSFLFNTIKRNINLLDKSPQVKLYFNERDFQYFSKNYKPLAELFKNPILLNKSSKPMIGGFRVQSSGNKMTLDYTVDNLIEKSQTNIQKIFSNRISDQKIKELTSNYEIEIKNKKEDLEEYLNRYDRI